jgi:hypothetical protein
MLRCCTLLAFTLWSLLVVMSALWLLLLPAFDSLLSRLWLSLEMKRLLSLPELRCVADS